MRLDESGKILPRTFGKVRLNSLPAAAQGRTEAVSVTASQLELEQNGLAFWERGNVPLQLFLGWGVFPFVKILRALFCANTANAAGLAILFLSCSSVQ